MKAVLFVVGIIVVYALARITTLYTGLALFWGYDGFWLPTLYLEALPFALAGFAGWLWLRPERTP